MTGALASVAGALRGHPLALVVVLLNVVFIGASAWLAERREANELKAELALIERCAPH